MQIVLPYRKHMHYFILDYQTHLFNDIVLTSLYAILLNHTLCRLLSLSNLFEKDVSYGGAHRFHG